MNKQEFIKVYQETFNTWWSYDMQSIGNRVYASKLADLYDAHPGWADEAEETAYQPVDMSESS